MRIIFSFFLALIVYSSILFFFLYFILNKQKEQKTKIVYIHKVVITPQKKRIEKIEKKVEIPKKKQPKIEKKVEKKPNIKSSKDSFSKAGKDIKLDDIFSNVDENIPTTKVKRKKQENMVKKPLKENSKTFQNEISKLKEEKVLKTAFITDIKAKKQDKNYLETQLSLIWEKIFTNQNDFINIQINIENGKLDFVVISTNLDTIRLNKFLSYIEVMDVKNIEKFNGIVKLKTELKD